MKVRNLLLLLLGSIFFLGLGYKYFEWSTLNKLSSYQSNFDVKEFDTNLQQQKAGKEVTDLMDSDSEKESKLTEDEQLNQFDKIIGKSNLYTDLSKDYLNLLKENLNYYMKLEKSSKFLLGKRGSFAKDLIKNQISYYQKEIENAEEGVAGNELFVNIYKILKDFNILLTYDVKGTANQKNYSANFSDVAILEKYTREDFKFTDEDNIKTFFTYGYEVLNKYKNYFSSYYEMTKDFVSGDEESASYKYATFQKDSIELNIDFDKITDEGAEKQINRSKAIIGITLNKISNIKRFKNDNLGYFPFLKKIESWKEDLVLCQLYSYKASLFQNITKKTIKFSNIDELFNELSQVSPKSDELDKVFNREVLTIKGLEEKEKYITFECKDEATGIVYPFDVTKED